MALTTVDFPWATCPIVPTIKMNINEPIHTSTHTDINGGLALNNLGRQRVQLLQLETSKRICNLLDAHPARTMGWVVGSREKGCSPGAGV